MTAHLLYLPFEATDSDSEPVAVVVRVVLLLIVVAATSPNGEKPETHRRTRVGNAGLVSTLFVASLAFHGLFWAFVATAGVVLAGEWRATRAGRGDSASAAAFATFTAALSTGAVIAMGLLDADAGDARNDAQNNDRGPHEVNVAAATVDWLERGNLFRAQATARQWARLEGKRPGAGTLVLSQIEWSLGHREFARKHAGTVTEDAPSPETARKAKELLDRFDAEGRDVR